MFVCVSVCEWIKIKKRRKSRKEEEDLKGGIEKFCHDFQLSYEKREIGIYEILDLSNNITVKIEQLSNNFDKAEQLRKFFDKIEQLSNSLYKIEQLSNNLK